MKVSPRHSTQCVHVAYLFWHVDPHLLIQCLGLLPGLAGSFYIYRSFVLRSWLKTWSLEDLSVFYEIYKTGPLVLVLGKHIDEF